MRALINEIESHRGLSVRTVYIGGGTPSYIEPHFIAEIMQAVYETFIVEDGAEISIECNPGTLNEDKLRIYRQAGINRLSIGLQSADNIELKRLGRIHTYEDFLESYESAVSVGYDNINVDLMSALPGQTEHSWERTLKTVTALNPAPAHLSVYGLIIEEGTPFARDSTLVLPDEDTELRMDALTREILAQAGYERYEISNYARPGYACRHNLTYWDRGEYLGVGLGASSLINERRLKNTSLLSAYLTMTDKVVEDIALSVSERMSEFMFLGLRKIEGVSEDRFRQAFGRSMWDIFAKPLSTSLDDGLLSRDGEFVRLTDRGLLLGNVVFSRFV